jgi:hypothetical protein
MFDISQISCANRLGRESRVNLYSVSNTLSQFSRNTSTAHSSLPAPNQFVYELQDAHRGEIARAFAFAGDSRRKILVTAGEDGRVALWPAFSKEQSQDDHEAAVNEDRKEREMLDIDMDVANSAADAGTGTKSKRRIDPRQDGRDKTGKAKEGKRGFRPY